MVEILSNKNLTTRFQIMVEIAASQPNVSQKDIAKILGITPQAVSDYLQQLSKDGLIISEGRSHYKLSPIGINWMIRQLNDAKEYFHSVEKVIWNIRVSPAIADGNIDKGQKIGLEMRDGLLYAIQDTGVGATGTAVTKARSGEIIGITDIRGIIDMQEGKVTIIEIPGIQKGKTKPTNLNYIKDVIDRKRPIAYLGLEALAILNSFKIEPDIKYAGVEAMIDAVKRGISPVIVSSDEELSVLIKRLNDANINYTLVSSNSHHSRDK